MQIILDNSTTATLPPAQVLQAIADCVLTKLHQPQKSITVGVFYVDANKIQEINREYRAKDKPTDVISFRLIDNPNFLRITPRNFPTDYDRDTRSFYLGEIFICYDVAVLQAKQYLHSADREILELFIHGMLHILGFDHETDADRAVMHQHELDIISNLDKILKKVGYM